MKYYALIFSSLILMSCSKYEENPAISLSSKKARMANTWVVNKATANDQDVTDDYDDFELYLTKSGDAELSAEYTVFTIDFSTDTDGTWEFANSKENLVLDFEDDNADREYQILKLTKDELWLRELGRDLEIELKEK